MVLTSFYKSFLPDFSFEEMGKRTVWLPEKFAELDGGIRKQELFFGIKFIILRKNNFDLGCLKQKKALDKK